MSVSEFKQSISENTQPDSALSKPLQALWWDANGNWDKSHDVCQSAGSLEGDWVHAYLHRKEGDIGNASYWYSRARKPVFKGSLEDEWTSMVESLLESDS
jgi:hypothetical protein